MSDRAVRMSLRTVAALLGVTVVSLHWLAAAAVPEPAGGSGQQVLIAADRVHNPQPEFESTSTLVEYRHGVAQSSVVLHVYSKLDPVTGQFQNLARYVAPVRDAGKMFLMSGNVMWFYDPAASTSIRISPQQQLLGEASVGDILSLNMSKDFNARLLGTESIEDASRRSLETWHLDLTARNSGAIYSRVQYWVQKKTYLPVRAYFYSDSGRVLKTAYYLAMKHVLGGIRPTKLIILDDIDTSVATEVSFSDFKKADIPNDWFQPGYLPRLH